MPSIPKAVLYYSPLSVWSAVALLGLEEKGYGHDEIDLRIVDLPKGENYDPTFLRLNPKATVPTLVVPYEKTLSEETESRYKAITETKVIVEFLDASRSAISHTHTTSDAPAPALAPATIAANTICRIIIDDLLHSDMGDPNKLAFLNAYDNASLMSLAQAVLPLFKGKQQALSGYLSSTESGNIHVSEKVKGLWQEKLEKAVDIIDILTDAEKPEGKLDEEAKIKRAEFLRTAQIAWQTDLKGILTRLSKELAGPYILGDQFCLADLHLTAWMVRVAKLIGCSAADDGQTVVSKLEARIGGGFSLTKDFHGSDVQRKEVGRGVQSKLAAFWDAVKERESFTRVYRNGLF